MVMNQRPMLIDLRHLIVGTYYGKRESSKEGYYYVQYIPLNSFKINSPIETEEPVPKESIVPVDPDKTNLPGIEQDYRIITSDADGDVPMLEKIMEIEKNRTAQLRNELDREQTEKEQHKRERIKQKRGQKEIEKEENETSKNSKTNRVNVDEW
jgi:hypothetical protein